MSMLPLTAEEHTPIRFPAKHHRVPRLRVMMTVDAVGGVWRYAMELARALQEFDVGIVFTGLGPKPSPTQVEEASHLGKLVWLEEPLDWIAPDEAALEGLPNRLARLAEEEGADVLHFNLPSQAVGIDTQLPVVVVSHSCVVTWWHAMRNEPLPKEWAWMKRQNAAGMARADAIVAPSGSHARALHQCYGDLPRLTVVHNGISAFLQGVEKEEFVFSAARWWDEGKNAVVLDQAAALISWPVVMAGARIGPNGQETRILHARHFGEISHRRVLAQVRQAGIVVSPSLYEPFGLAALEGARAGAALVLSDIPTYRELWNEAAVFFDPHDPKALAAAVNALSVDGNLREEMGSRALARSRRYRPDVQAGCMAELYDELVGQRAEVVA